MEKPLDGRIISALGWLRRPPEHKDNFFMSNSPSRYTCNEYREEMLLLSLRRRLADPSLPAAEKEALQKEIQELEKQMGMV